MHNWNEDVDPIADIRNTINRMNRDACIYVNVELLQRAEKIRRRHPDSEFCQDCGIVDPPGGFYPMQIIGPNSVSPYLCHVCERRRRGGLLREQ